MIRSLWTLTFDPVGAPLVLLSQGDAMEEEIKFSISKGLEVVDLESSQSPFLRPRGNVVWQIQYHRRLTAASDTAARAAVLDWQISLASLGKKPLKCQFYGENDYYTFASAFVTNVTSWRKVEPMLPSYVLTLAITATGLTRTVV